MPTRPATLLLALLLAAPLSAAAQGNADKEAIRAALQRAATFAARGERVRELQSELEDASTWMQKALLLVELADLRDRRAVPALAGALRDKNPHVSAFALRGLAALPAGEVRKGGGAEAGEGLLEAYAVKAPYHRSVGHGLLVAFVGEDLGQRPKAYRAWLKEHGPNLKIEAVDGAFDADRFDAAAVAAVRKEGLETRVRPRLPNVTRQLEALEAQGLDVALCLDETVSMVDVIEEAKANIDLLVDALTVVAPDARVGLVTYNDLVVQTVPLAKSPRRLKSVLADVEAAGGGDIPEGVDRALVTALAKGFGWRRKSAKAVVVLGDAPPHPPNVEPVIALVRRVHERREVVVNAVSTGSERVPELDRIAVAGGGRSLRLSQPAALVTEVLLLSFGEALRVPMQRFVPALLEILAAQRGKDGKR